MFLGTHQVTLDGERALQIPPAFREGLLQGLFVTRGFEGNLLLMPEPAFNIMTDHLNRLNMIDPNVRLLERLLLAQAARLEMDAQGCIRLPAELAEAAGLENEAALVGQGDCIEAWAPTAWNKQVDLLLGDEALKDRFASLELTLV